MENQEPNEENQKGTASPSTKLTDEQIESLGKPFQVNESAHEHGLPVRALPVSVYALYLAGPMTLGLSAIIGMVMAALLDRHYEEEPFLRSHARNQQTIAGISLLAWPVILIAPAGYIGLPLFLAWFTWASLRSVSGLIALVHFQPVEKPRGWLRGDFTRRERATRRYQQEQPKANHL